MPKNEIFRHMKPREPRVRGRVEPHTSHILGLELSVKFQEDQIFGGHDFTPTSTRKLTLCCGCVQTEAPHEN